MRADTMYCRGRNFIATLLAAYDEFESRFGKVGKGRGSKTDTVKNAIDRLVADFSLTDY